MICKQNILQPNVLQPLAVLAARNDQVDALDLCLSRGVNADADLDQAIISSLQSTSMLEVLWSYNRHNIRQTTEFLNQLARSSIYETEVLVWLVEHGATLDLNTYKSAAFGLVSIPVMKIMADQFGPEPLRHTGSLQMVARRGHADVVTYLIEIGLDPNEMPPPIDERELLYPASYEAVTNKHFTTAQVLVMCGAKVDHLYRTRNSILTMARERGDEKLIGHINNIKDFA